MPLIRAPRRPTDPASCLCACAHVVPRSCRIATSVLRPALLGSHAARSLGRAPHERCRYHGVSHSLVQPRPVVPGVHPQLEKWPPFLPCTCGCKSGGVARSRADNLVHGAAREFSALLAGASAAHGPPVASRGPKATPSRDMFSPFDPSKANGSKGLGPLFFKGIKES